MTATKAALEHVILVDKQNKEVGIAEKIAAHQLNQLHRAFSIFIFRHNPASNNLELLIQQRALLKYHSGGLWTNTCCSHPRAGETVISAGERRLHEELGIITTLKELGWFHYNVHFSNGLSENEIDHVLVGKVPFSQKIAPNSKEVLAYRWIALNHLQQELAKQPKLFTSWLKQALDFINKTSYEELLNF